MSAFRDKFLLLLLASAFPSCTRCPSEPSSISRHTIALGSKTLPCVAYIAEKERTRAVADFAASDGSQAYILLYPRARHHHTYLLPERLRNRWPRQTRFTVLYLAGDGKILQMQELNIHSEEGIESEGEVLRVLFLSNDLARETGAAVGTFITLSQSLSELKPEELPTALVNGHRMFLELATSEAARQRGLMWRRKMSPDDGMIFIYRGERPHTFWMVNCYMDIAVAYVRGDGAIANHLVMEARKVRSDDWASNGPIKYAVEMNKNWFTLRGIRNGDKIQFPPEVSNASADE